MVNFMVERATSDVLIGPDWARNAEICDILNHNPAQVKDVVKGIKKKLKSRNSKVQFLALSLLEAMLNNCGDIVHHHVADRDILTEMVKVFKKRSDFFVKEKIMILVDTWQEFFGGRYPQYFAAYQDLLRAGAVFPPRSERPPPNPQNVRNFNQQEVAESSGEPDFPTLSLTEIENARAIMNVLEEMLNALEPGNKEGLGQEVLIDLVEQCRVFKQRVVHLVNSTSDESLLDQGLALNDDLQKVLAKHQSLAKGTSSQADNQIPKSVSLDGPLVDTGVINNQSNERSISGSAAGSQPIPPAVADPKIDLLSFDDYDSPEVDNSLALVPLGEPQQITPAPHNALVPFREPQQTTPAPHNALVPFDLFSDLHTQGLPGQANSWNPQFQQLPSFHVNGIAPSMGFSQYEQSYDLGTAATWNSQLDPGTAPTWNSQLDLDPGTAPTWNSQLDPQQQQAIVPYGTQISFSFPPPPWETQEVESSPVQVPQYPESQYHMGSDQAVGMYIQPNASDHLPANNSNQAIQGNQFADFHPQQNQGSQFMAMVPYQMSAGQMAPYPQQMYGNPQMGASGFGQQQYLDQQMQGLSLIDDNGYQVSTSSYVPPSSKPSKPEDKMFGDLVDMAKVKPTATTPGTPGNM